MKINVKYRCLLCLLTLSMITMAVENPNVGNPLQPSSTPAASGQTQRFITRPGVNTYGQSGNDIVSGNVGGFKYFRGVVPYGSSYYSGAYTSDSGSAAVNNFLRRSADPIVSDRNPGQTRAYYDPRRTVSSLYRPDSDSGLSKPQLIGQGRQTPYRLSGPTQQLQVNPVTRPITPTEMDLETILARQESVRQQAIKKAEAETEAKIKTEPEPVQKSFFDTALLSEPINQPQQPDQPVTEESETEPERTETEAEAQTEMTPAQRTAQLQKEIQDALNESESLPTRDDQLETESQRGESEDQPSYWQRSRSDLLSEVDSETALSAEGRKVLGEHETFAALAEDKFDRYMLLAETHLKAGQFYKAADIYALANVWKPEDARGYLGQSFSLFFAGEYMSSGYYLSRAIELNPDLALGKYNLTELAGSRDVFENSDVELLAAQQKSYSGELAFLASYVAYQEGRAEQAVRLINAAKEAMPDSVAVTRLKNLIDPEPVLE